ncbi:MAG: acyl-CoA thioesterase, partial [Polyangiaceae bacterium]|nr:acyl-CoA thioesterase [Polyangiaceae bacterium]
MLFSDIPRHLVSRHDIRVRFCETDLMGIVHHANYLAYFEAGRVD